MVDSFYSERIPWRDVCWMSPSPPSPPSPLSRETVFPTAWHPGAAIVGWVLVINPASSWTLLLLLFPSSSLYIYYYYYYHHYYCYHDYYHYHHYYCFSSRHYCRFSFCRELIRSATVAWASEILGFQMMRVGQLEPGHRTGTGGGSWELHRTLQKSQILIGKYGKSSISGWWFQTWLDYDFHFIEMGVLSETHWL